MELHTFGIAIPTYKRANLLQRALDSVIYQSYESWVVCVVDDCSPDNTPQIMIPYAERPNIHYIRLEKNSGPCTARNQALSYLMKEKECSHIIFLDDDDYMTPDALKENNKIINDNPEYSWFVSRRIHEDGSYITFFENIVPTSYIDYLTETNVKGDLVNCIASELIGDIRFTDYAYGHESHFFIQLSAKATMFLFDYKSMVTEYLEDGLSLSAPKKTKSEKKRIRKIEKKLLFDAGYVYEHIELIKAKKILDKSYRSEKPYNVVKFMLRYIKARIRSIVADIRLKLNIYLSLI